MSSRSPSFVHLHVHSEYSLLDGASRVSDLAKRAADLEMPALALTDHGVMYGAVDFYQACRASGVKPIIGCELYVTEDRTRRDPQKDRQENISHLTVLARDIDGYRNLIKLCSAASIEGFYYRPRVDHDLLREYRSGLIGMSACLGGEIPKFILGNRYDEAKRRAAEYREIFGKDSFFLELMDHGMSNQQKVNEALVEIARELDIPLVCSNDSHFTQREHHGAQDVLLCIGTGRIISDTDRMRYADSLYLKSPQEMAVTFRDHPDAIANTLLIADMCNLELDLGKVHFPDFQVPENHTLDSYLEHLCRENLQQRYPKPTKRIEDRLRYELSVICQKGYSGYFLCVQDFVQFAKSRGILVGPGRGSAAGSIVSYLLGVTNIDPIAYGLYFERFLNPERESSPDIDIDFQDNRRDEVLDYVRRKYGEDKVAQIITFGTLKARAAVRDVGRAMGIDLPTVDRIAKLIPQNPINYVSIERALELVKELKDLYDSEPRIRELLDTAKNIEGLTRHASVHACGTVISRFPLTDVVPLQPVDQKSPEAGAMTQYHAKCVEAVGLLKMDFLGLDFSTVIAETIERVEERHGIDIDIDAIPLDDLRTYEMLSRGDGVGVFQLESPGMRQLLKELRPDRFEHIVPLVALYRPGPMDEIPRFVAGRHGKRITYLHPKLKPILQETFGVLLYQEQVMRAAVDLAGFTPQQAELLMRAMSKKQVVKMKEMQPLFVKGCVAHEVEEDVALQIWERMVTFSGYGFNKSHSAAYGLIAYQTAYLKANYPQEYMAARLTSLMDSTTRMASHIEDARRIGIQVLLPDVNESERHFTVVGKDIRFGLLGIKTIGENVVNAIVETRKSHGRFRDIYDFCEVVPARTVTKSAIETLIKCGAFDTMHPNRAQTLAVFDSAIDSGQRVQRDALSGQGSLFGSLDDESLRTHPPLPQVADVANEQRLAWEKEYLGLFLSDHPLSALRDRLQDKLTATTAQLADLKEGERVTIGGMVSELRRITDRNGRPMMFLTVEDFEGSVEVVVFSSVYEKYVHNVARDSVVLVKGSVNFVTSAAQQKMKGGRNGGNGATVNEEGEMEETTEARETPKLIAQEIFPLDRETTALPDFHESSTPSSSEDQFEMSSEEDALLDEPPGMPQPVASPPTVIHVRIPSSANGGKILKEVQSLLLQHHGAIPVVLHFTSNGEETKLRLSHQYAVAYGPDFCMAAERLLGKQAIVLE